MDDDETIRTMLRRIIAEFDPLRVLLFGSRARGEAHAGSDVDLLIVLPEVLDKRRQAVQARRCLSDLAIPKDVVITSPEEIARRGGQIGSVLRSALREGKVLYERT